MSLLTYDGHGANALAGISAAATDVETDGSTIDFDSLPLECESWLASQPEDRIDTSLMLLR